MKIKRVLAMGLTLVMALGVFAGCAKNESVTAESLMSKVSGNTLKADVTTDIGLTFSYLDVSMNTTVSVKMSLENASDVTHALGTTTSTSPDGTETEDIDVYTERISDNEFRQYTREGDVWVKSVIENDSSAGLFNSAKITGAKLRPNLYDFSGARCYIVDANLPMDTIGTLTGSLFDGVDLSDTQISVSYYFNSVNKNLIAMRIDAAKSLGNIIVSMLEEQLGTDVTVKVSKFNITARNIERPSDLIVAIPSDVRENAIDIEDYVPVVDLPAIDNDDDNDGDDIRDEQWSDFNEWNDEYNQLTIDGKTFVVGKVIYGELFDVLGEPDDYTEGMTVLAGKVDSFLYTLDDDMNSLYVSFMNTTDVEQSVLDCVVYNVSVMPFVEMYEGVTLAGVKFDTDTETTLIERFGQPHSIVKTDDMTNIRWQTEDGDAFNVIIDVKTGSILEVCTNLVSVGMPVEE